MTSIRSCNNWLVSDVPSDVMVEVGGTSFGLHKLPLISKSGRMRKAFAEGNVSILRLPEMPGGAEAFELAAKHCYGVDLEITPSNVAMIRCAAAYLEMNLQSDDNIDAEEESTLESISEAYIDEITLLPNIADCIAVLNSCQTLLPLADELNIIGRCIDGIVSKLECNSALPQYNWGIEELSDVNINFFQRISSAMRNKGLSEEISGAVLMQYAQNSIVRKNQEQRDMLETVVNLLPPGKNATPTSFLSGLLRTAAMLDAAPHCRTELERRLALQLDLATSRDLVVLSVSCGGESDTLFDVDVVRRIVTNFLHLECHASDRRYTPPTLLSGPSQDRVQGLTQQSAMSKVSELVDSYLAEIATDQNLAVSKFIGLAEILPDDCRLLDDGLYRAIDICLKAHPSVTDMERRKLCGLMDCQRLSQEARLHASRNDRMPVNVVVQVLFFEQLRIRHADSGDQPRQQKLTNATVPGVHISARDNYAVMRLENRELRFKIERMTVRLTDLEREYGHMKEVIATSTANRFIRSVSNNLAKFHALLRSKIDGLSVILSSYKVPRHFHRHRCQRVLH